MIYIKIINLLYVIINLIYRNILIYPNIFIRYIRKRICATTCYLNPLEKDWFLTKMSEISGFDAIIYRIFKHIAFR